EPPKLPEATKDPAIAKGLAYVGRAIGMRPEKLSEKERKKRKVHTATLEKLYKDLEEAPPEKQKRIRDQIGQLDEGPLFKGTYFGADAWGDLYFLWSVERVAVVYD